MKWTTTNLGNITKRIRNGLTIKQSANKGGLPITRIETISNGIVDNERVGFAGIEDGKYKEWYLSPGEILFSHINSEERIGNCAIYKGDPYPLIHGMNLLCITPDEKIVNPRFLFYAIRSQQFRSSLRPIIKRAVNQASVSIGNLKNIGILLPPISEQRRIVEILDQADALRKKRAEADAKAARILPALFYKMFGDPATNPMGWPVVRGEKIFDKIGYGVGSPPPFSEDGIPFLRAGNIKPSGIKRENLVFFEDKYASSIARSRVNTGDVIIVRRGAYTGDCVVIPEEYDGAYVGYDLICRPNTETNPHWFAAAWNFPTVWQRIENIRKRAAQQGLNKDQIESFSLPRPPKDKQDIFANQISSLSAYSNGREKITRKLEIIFQTFLHRAFTGDLTAKWREMHLEELLAEMEEQTKMLEGN